MNPVRFAPRNVRREVDQLSATGFERYIADRFSDLGWLASEQPHRNSFDVEAISPTGKRYLLEVKYKEQNDNPTPLDAVRQILPAKLALRPDLAIVVTSSPKGFTRDAKKFAAQHGIALWTVDELQIMADAASSGELTALPSIGLEVPPPLPLASRTVQTTQPRTTPPLHIFWKGLVVVLWLGILGSVFLPSLQTNAGLGILGVANSNFDLESENAVKNEVEVFLRKWDSLYKEALMTNDSTSLLPMISGQQQIDITRRFTERRNCGCVLRIAERSPWRQGEVTLISATRASTFVVRDAQYIETCPNQEERVLRDGQQVNITYDVEKVNGQWIILQSETTGGVTSTSTC
jgi:Restriction endonuclease